MILVTCMLVSSQQTWEPTASSSAKFGRKTRTIHRCTGVSIFRRELKIGAGASSSMASAHSDAYKGTTETVFDPNNEMATCAEEGEYTGTATCSFHSCQPVAFSIWTQLIKVPAGERGEHPRGIVLPARMQELQTSRRGNQWHPRV
jgi:hypothetical protein